MKLEEIGFYSLNDERARTATDRTQLYRCELLITDACNFSCPYCRGCKEEYKGTIKEKAWRETLALWISQGLKNVRFSGGEPTLHPDLLDMVRFCKLGGVERIAVSSNGSNVGNVYEDLVDEGVNDFSISLDACCAEDGDLMAGGKKGSWERVVQNIRRLVRMNVYVTVGVVLNEMNVAKTVETVVFAHELGVSDIRLISSAQWNQPLREALEIPKYILEKHPILRYRVNHFGEGRGVRGLTPTDNKRCPLVLDDVIVLGGKHFPCPIYTREHGQPIGDVGPDMRLQRKIWADTHDTHADPICRNNCLDICAAYNNRYAEFHA